MIVPADSAYTNEQDTVIKVPTPVIEGRDISYPMRIRQAKDYFFDIPEEEPKYIAYARKGEPLFLQASTSRLKGRKLFVWGQGTGSQHWQNFLTRRRAGIVKSRLVWQRPNTAASPWEREKLGNGSNCMEPCLLMRRLCSAGMSRRRRICVRLWEGCRSLQISSRNWRIQRRWLADRVRKILDGSGFGYLENQMGLYREKRERLPAHLAFTSWQEIANPDMRIAPGSLF